MVSFDSSTKSSTLLGSQRVSTRIARKVASFAVSGKVMIMTTLRPRLLACVIACAMLAVPVNALAGVQYRFVGKGWGHGIGMSQYGAKGFAERGSSAADIVAHYYRNTVLGPVPADARSVSVLLTQDRSEVSFVVEGASAQATSATGAVTQLVAGDQVLVTRTGGTSTAVRRRAGADTTIGTANNGQVVAITGTDGAVATRFSTDGGARNSSFRGTYIVQVMGGSLGVINRVGIDAYIKGVVPSEVPTSWPASALQAQALAARSYAIATRKPGASFDLYADTRSQVYRGIDEEESSTNAAVDATAGQAILHAGKVIPAFFSSTSGGQTAAINDVWNSAPRAYLESVPDPYERSPYSVWPEKIGYSPGSLARALRIGGTVKSIDTVLNGSSRVSQLRVRTTGGTSIVTGPTTQVRLALRSTYFRVERLELAVRSRSGSRVSLGGSAPSGGVTELWIRPSGSSWQLAKKLDVKQGGFRARIRLRRTSEVRLKRNGWFGPGVRLNP